MGREVIGEVHGDEVKADNTGNRNVEVHNDKMSLISESNADAGYVAVMVSFQYASPTDDAVMAAWRLNMLTGCAPLP